MSASQRIREQPATRLSRKTRGRQRPLCDEPAGGPSRARRAPPPRIALTVNEACESLGVGWDLFHESIEPELRIVRIGRRKLIPLAELQAWLDRHAEKIL